MTCVEHNPNLHLAVEVTPRKGAAVIPHDNAVGVEHGNDLEDELVPQGGGAVAVGAEVVQHPLHHPGGVRLARVDPESSSIHANDHNNHHT